MPTPKSDKFLPPKATPQTKKVFNKNSNKKLIKNAISMVCMAGGTNKQEREEVLKIIDSTDFDFYLILFRGTLGRQDFKALYSHDGHGNVNKIYGP